MYVYINTHIYTYIYIFIYILREYQSVDTKVTTLNKDINTIKNSTEKTLNSFKSTMTSDININGEKIEDLAESFNDRFVCIYVHIYIFILICICIRSKCMNIFMKYSYIFLFIQTCIIFNFYT
jgi:hypothetical protein